MDPHSLSGTGFLDTTRTLIVSASLYTMGGPGAGCNFPSINMNMGTRPAVIIPLLINACASGGSAVKTSIPESVRDRLRGAAYL